MEQKITTIKVEDLHLWTENPREPMDAELTDSQIIEKAIQDKKSKWDLPKLLNKMGNHYDFSELPTVVKIDNKFVVFDGNRRIAVLKYLQNKETYQSFGGGLFLESEPQNLRDLKEIPCNVCDKNTALDNIERKHMDSGSWDALERDYFSHIHRNESKSLFLEFEELTGLVSSHPKLNQRFVKDEVLTKNNLEEIGISIENGKFLSSNSNYGTQKIIDELIKEIESGAISTRTDNRKGSTRLSPAGGLKGTLKKSSDNNFKIDSFNPRTAKEKDRKNIIKNNEPTPAKRKTRRNREIKDILFGEELYLKPGSVNDLYSILDHIYNKNKDDKNILPVIGISLRLIMEVAGREYFKSVKDNKKAEEDVIFSSFMKRIKKEGILKNKQTTMISLDNAETLTAKKFEGLIGKYAHGNIEYDKANILNCSKIIGTILTYYFSKEKS